MAVNVLPILLMAMLLVAVPSAVQSQSCDSQKFSNNKKFALCEKLPALGSQLHYTYNATNGSLSIAFVATPSKEDGWVSWSINPTASGMVGAQAFVAYQVNGTVKTKTLNIVGYRDFKPGNLLFPFWDVSAEKKNGVITLYASLAVNKTVVNQVWQVGPGVDEDGRLQPHAFSGENLLSKSALSLTGAPVPTAAPAPSPSKSAPSPSRSAPSPSETAPAPGNSTNNGSLGKMKMSGGFDLVLASAFMSSILTLCLF
uniref:DOMON domain-containing protein n=1 Tax=Kalanchoe fedtschenkoi TaxID=63787 RepID=A0A7N0U489_KALFE